MYSEAKNGWGKRKCVAVKAPRAIPPPNWMEGMSATLTSINNEGDADKAITVQQEAVGGGVEYFNCRKVKTYRGVGEWARKVQTMFVTDISFETTFEYVVDVAKHIPLRVGFHGHHVSFSPYSSE